MAIETVDILTLLKRARKSVAQHAEPETAPREEP